MNPLLERYLLHVKSYLPRRQREDVAAELEENLRSQMEEREQASGRPLTDDQVAEILTGFGHPMEVAGRYLPRRYLIGPSTFPAYWYGIKALVTIFAVLVMLTALAALVRGDLSAALDGAGEMVWNLLAWGSIVTFVFTMLDRSDFRFFDRFDPRKLNDEIVRLHGESPQPISRFGSACVFVFSAAALLWWIGAFAFPAWNIEDWQIEIFALQLSWGDSYWLFRNAVFVLLAVGLLRAARNFIRPYQTVPALVFRIVQNLGWVAVLLWVTQAPDIVAIGLPENAPNAAEWEIMLPDVRETLVNVIGIIALVAAISVILDVVRVARSPRRKPARSNSS